jgi:hypothetical protein
MDTLTDFILFVAQVMFWYFVGTLVVDFLGALYINHQRKELDVRNRIVDRLNKIVHQVKIEKHGDMYYWFDNDDDRFLAQGKTLDEIVVGLKQRFIDHVFIVNDKVMIGPNFELVDASQENMVKVLDR